MAEKSQLADSGAEKKLIRQEVYQYSGPLPHPKLLQEFDEKTREKIVLMAVKQSIHRQSIEKTVIDSNKRNEFFGMIFSFLITVFMMLVGGLLIHENKNVIGFLTIFAPAIFHAKNYMDQKKEEKNFTKSDRK
ncbi:MAG: hypothetical protein ABIJ03_04080 [Patescibacteria group bacterium]|nr:hypothetical protein [Patescibacteria group bacterium]